MTAAFLSDSHPSLKSVYSEETVSRIAELTELLPGYMNKADVIEGKLTNVEVIFSTWGMPAFTADEIKKYLPSLKFIFYGAGSVQGFARPFLSEGVRIFSAWGANGVPVAEYTVSAILLANKGFFGAARKIKNYSEAGSYSRSHRGNFGADVGIVGAGMIGKMVINYLKPYRLSVKVFDPFLSDDDAEKLGVKKTALDELFKTCTVVSNHLANNDRTAGMIGYEHFSEMVPYATFINTGRGRQVRENDLIRALEERPDITAVLDVTSKEPLDPDNRLLSLENAFLTPHIAGSQRDEHRRMGEYMEEEFENTLSGRPVRYEVTMKMLETMA